MAKGSEEQEPIVFARSILPTKPYIIILQLLNEDLLDTKNYAELEGTPPGSGHCHQVL